MAHDLDAVMERYAAAATTNGERCSIEAVDVLPIVDGRIAHKDISLDTAAVASVSVSGG